MKNYFKISLLILGLGISLRAMEPIENQETVPVEQKQSATSGLAELSNSLKAVSLQAMSLAEAVEQPAFAYDWIKTFDTLIGPIQRTPESINFMGRIYKDKLQIEQIYKGYLLTLVRD